MLSQVHGSGANEISRGERVERPGRPGRRRAVRARRAARRSRRSRRVRGRPSPPSGASSNHGDPRRSGRAFADNSVFASRREARGPSPDRQPSRPPRPRPRPTGPRAVPVGTAAASEPVPSSSRRGLVARASDSGARGGGATTPRSQTPRVSLPQVHGDRDPRKKTRGARRSQSERRPRRAACQEKVLQVGPGKVVAGAFRASQAASTSELQAFKSIDTCFLSI